MLFGFKCERNILEIKEVPVNGVKEKLASS
jgi:hypothetical protein